MHYFGFEIQRASDCFDSSMNSKSNIIGSLSKQGIAVVAVDLPRWYYDLIEKRFPKLSV